MLASDNRRLLVDSGTVVWLRARPDTNARRVGDGAARPLLGHDPAGAMTRLFAERAPFYGEVADLVVDVDDLSPEEVVARILQFVGPNGAAARPRRSEPQPPTPTGAS